jgi:uncharacterized protein (TIGR02001 family)
MNKKLTALLLGALTIGAVSSRAQTAAPIPAPTTPSLSVTVTPTFVSQYMFRGQRLAGLSFQPVVEATYANYTLGVWSSFPMKDEVAGVSDPEIDPYGSVTFNVNDSLSIVPGFTFYTYPNADLHNGFYRSTFEPNIAVNYTIAGIKFTPKFYYDITLDGPTLELTAAYALPLKDLGTELDFSATYGDFIQRDVAKDAAPQVKAWGEYWSVGVSAPFQITKNSKLILGFAYVKGEDQFIKQGGTPKVGNGLAVGRGVASVAYAWTF